MKRIRTKAGDIFKIYFDEDMFTYGRLASKVKMAFYDYLNQEDASLEEIVNAPVLFTVGTAFKDALREERWFKIGHLSLEDYPMVIPYTYSQNMIHPELCERHYYTDEDGFVSKAVTPEECIGLEKMTLWFSPHIEQRLEDHYAGRRNDNVYRRRVRLTAINHPDLSVHGFLKEVNYHNFNTPYKIHEIRLRLSELCRAIEAEEPTTLEALYQLSQAAIDDLNFYRLTWKQDEATKTWLTDLIIKELHTIAKAYGFENAETSLLIEGNNWDEVFPDDDLSSEELLTQAKKLVQKQNFLASLDGDEHYPDAILDKGKQILIDLSDTLKKNKLKKLDDFYALTHAATHQFNVWQEELEHGIDTIAREVIAGDFKAIALAYGFKDADIETIIEPRDW